MGRVATDVATPCRNECSDLPSLSCALASSRILNKLLPTARVRPFDEPDEPDGLIYAAPMDRFSDVLVPKVGSRTSQLFGIRLASDFEETVALPIGAPVKPARLPRCCGGRRPPRWIIGIHSILPTRLSGHEGSGQRPVGSEPGIQLVRLASRRNTVDVGHRCTDSK